jgi:hypothetical protein
VFSTPAHFCPHHPFHLSAFTHLPVVDVAISCKRLLVAC